MFRREFREQLLISFRSDDLEEAVKRHWGAGFITPITALAYSDYCRKTVPFLCFTTARDATQTRWLV